MQKRATRLLLIVLGALCAMSFASCGGGGGGGGGGGPAQWDNAQWDNAQWEP